MKFCRHLKVVFGGRERELAGTLMCIDICVSGIVQWYLLSLRVGQYVVCADKSVNVRGIGVGASHTGNPRY